MKDWFLRQTPRDRIIVLVVGTLVLLGFVYAVFWYPLQSRLSTTERALDSKRELLEFVQDARVRLQASGGVSTRQCDTGTAPYLLIDQKIRNAGLSPPERVEPSGANGARVTFSEVEFDKLVLVLAELESACLDVSTMTLTRKETGTVSARFNMERT